MTLTPEKSMEKLIERINNLDLVRAPYSDGDELIADAVALFAPFLLNPERHREHVKMLLTYHSGASVLQAMNSILRVYHLPIIGPYMRSKFSKSLEEFRRKAAEARQAIIDSVVPGKLDLDVLPIESLKTSKDFRAVRKRLVMVKTRGVVNPFEGREVRSISHTLQVHSPKDCQFIDAFPSSETEAAGQREIAVTESGKFVSENSMDAKLASELSGGFAKISTDVTAKDRESWEWEAGASHKTNQDVHLVRVINTVMGNTAQWEILKTPKSIMLGSHVFSATLLVPESTKTIGITIHHESKIADWGAADLRREFEISVP